MAEGRYQAAKTDRRARWAEVVVPVLVGLVALGGAWSLGTAGLSSVDGSAVGGVVPPEPVRPPATQVVATIGVGADPQAIAINPETGIAYVTRLGAPSGPERDDEDPARRGTLVVLDTNTRQVTRTITLGIDPVGVGLDRSGATAWVANSGERSVSAVDTAAGRVVNTLDVGEEPRGVGVHPGTGMIYVANTGEDSLAVIDPQSRFVLDTMGIPSRPISLAFEEATGVVFVSKSESAGVEVIDPTQPQGEFSAGERPWGLAIDQAVGAVYVANWGGNTVTVAEARTRRWWDTIMVGSKPYGVAVDQGARAVYVTNWESDSVSVIDANTRQVVNTIPVGPKPQGVVVDPRNGQVYVVNSGDGSVSVLSAAA